MILQIASCFHHKNKLESGLAKKKRNASDLKSKDIIYNIYIYIYVIYINIYRKTNKVRFRIISTINWESKHPKNHSTIRIESTTQRFRDCQVGIHKIHGSRLRKKAKCNPLKTCLASLDLLKAHQKKQDCTRHKIDLPNGGCRWEKLSKNLQ